MIIDVNTSDKNDKCYSVTAYHPSGSGKAGMWVVNGREYNTTYTGKMDNAEACFKALKEWLAAKAAV